MSTFHQLRRRQLQRRSESGEQTGTYGGEQRERQHRAIDVHLFEARHVGRSERNQRAEDPRRGQDREQSTEHCENHRFDEKVPHQRAAARPQRSADGQFALAGHPARE